ncbi:MAG: type IV secretory system conjugative DNA transfer family protein [Methylococcales bacterium]|jgi:type IV secretory pathway TraG/TraD family ATPase VirD4|nr:type IV secretory system conjugative DNA transfer family protein [Methylococcales bacterium]MBT7442985.1 type IV secretory system conjugative DNA transfer family protein [Methylococcales bacterium]
MDIHDLSQWIEDKTALSIYYWTIVGMKYWLLWGVLGGISLISTFTLNNRWLVITAIIGFCVSVIFQPVLYYTIPDLSDIYLNQHLDLENKHLYAYFIGFTTSSPLWFLLQRSLISWFDDKKQKFTKKTGQTRDTRTDIRSVKNQLPIATKPFNPEKYFHKQKIFCGLNPKGDPVYMPQENWVSSHADIIGTTGSGKGVIAGVLLTQAVNQHEAVIVIDPKNDEYLPHVMGQAAKRADVPFYNLNFVGTEPQWNPFLNKTTFEIEELFAAGFGQSDKGSDADFYRLNDRASARAFANQFTQSPDKLPNVFGTLLQRQEALLKESPKFKEDLNEIASMDIVNVLSGINLEKAIEEGAVIYLRGSLRNPKILKLQKMFVLSVMQHCENRDRETARHVCIFLDEFKYLISKPALEALGAIRDKRAHVMLAHQSLGDLKDCPKDIDPESVISSINENCALKFAYKVNDPDTAEWLARMSGKILVDDERRKFVTGSSFAETRDPERMLSQTERCLIDTNMLQSLPKSCAVMYGNGLANFVFTSPIQVEKKPEYTHPTAFPETQMTHQIKPHSNTKPVTSVAEELVNVD